MREWGEGVEGRTLLVLLGVEMRVHCGGCERVKAQSAVVLVCQEAKERQAIANVSIERVA